MANYEPCSICEEYIEGVICNNDKCPVGMMKAENKRLQKEKYRLQKALNQSEDYRLIAKSEAIKEFEGRLKEKLYGIPTVYNAHFSKMVAELIEEMAEDGSNEA